jgi:hypothetical protein
MVRKHEAKAYKSERSLAGWNTPEIPAFAKLRLENRA